MKKHTENKIKPKPAGSSTSVKLLKCVLITVYTTVVNNTSQNSSDNLPSYPPDNHNNLDDDYSLQIYTTVSTVQGEGANMNTNRSTHREILNRQQLQQTQITQSTELVTISNLLCCSSCHQRLVMMLTMSQLLQQQTHTNKLFHRQH